MTPASIHDDVIDDIQNVLEDDDTWMLSRGECTVSLEAIAELAWTAIHNAGYVVVKAGGNE